MRLLVPGASDIPAVSPLSRAGYRPLLEAGVRVFEWNGTMLHAKTAVADGLWSRVGSTNLNLASWMSNYELDVAIEDAAFARTMAAQYERDLARSTEIVLTRRNRVRPTEAPAAAGSRGGARRAMSGSAGRAAAGAVSVGSALGAALTNRRTLGPAEAGLLAKFGICGPRALCDHRRGLAARCSRGPSRYCAAWLAHVVAGRHGRCGAGAETGSASCAEPRADGWPWRARGGLACYNSRHAPVAQLDRVPGYEPGGRGFKSCRARHTIKGLLP